MGSVLGAGRRLTARGHSLSGLGAPWNMLQRGFMTALRRACLAEKVFGQRLASGPSEWLACDDATRRLLVQEKAKG